jgi:lipoate-protein ligase B
MKITVEDWGTIEYSAAYERQKELVNAVIKGAPGRIVFCEHPPVLTLGRSYQEGSLLYTKEEIAERGVDLQTIDRGGDITLHAPGQLVVYCILDLNQLDRNLKSYLEKLEQVAVDLLKDFGILAISIPGKRGVFVKADKITSIGIGVRKWVSYHGLGINVNTNLSLFSLIKPCGLDVQMTSIAKLLGHPVAIEDVKSKWIANFSRIFEVQISHE